MEFYTVKSGYIAHLKGVESKVSDNYRGAKPYIGVLFEINGIKYIAPLTSHKASHDRIKSSTPTVFKIHSRTDETDKLGMVQLNNMIPVMDEHIELMDFDAQDEKYKVMLKKQQEFLRHNREHIVDKAQKLYRLVVVKRTPHFRGLSCKFDLLEGHMKKFEIEG